MSLPRSTFVPKHVDTLAQNCQNVSQKVHGTVPSFSLSGIVVEDTDWWQDEIGDILLDVGQPITLE